MRAGLPEEELERVFQPFYRTSGTRKSALGGVGLGLAVCRSIARATGGDVNLIRGEPGLIAQVRLPLGAAASGPRLVFCPRRLNPGRKTRYSR